jgi:hypothetical protein
MLFEYSESREHRAIEGYEYAEGKKIDVLYPHVDLGYDMKWKGIRNEGKEAGKNAHCREN